MNVLLPMAGRSSEPALERLRRRLCRAISASSSPLKDVLLVRRVRRGCRGRWSSSLSTWQASRGLAMREGFRGRLWLEGYGLQLLVVPAALMGLLIMWGQLSRLLSSISSLLLRRRCISSSRRLAYLGNLEFERIFLDSSN